MDKIDYLHPTAIAQIKAVLNGEPVPDNTDNRDGHIHDVRYLTPYAVEQIIEAGGSGASSADKVSYDNTTSGLTATDVQGAIDEVLDQVDDLSAAKVSYDNATSGLTATTVQSAIDEVVANLGGFVAVENYGAKGDGVTDDTQAIQTAINNSYGVRLGAKTYKITQPLIVRESSCIIGCGMKSVLKLVGCDGITANTGLIGVIMRDFKIMGDKSENQCGLRFTQNMPKLVIDNLFITECGDWGIYAEKSWEYSVRNVNVSSNANGMILRDSNSSEISKIVAFNNTGYGIIIASSSNARISGTIQENGFTGLYLQGCFACNVDVYGEQNGYAGTTNETKSQVVFSSGEYSSEVSSENRINFYLNGGKTSDKPSSYGFYMNWGGRNLIGGFAKHHKVKDVYETGNSSLNIVLNLNGDSDNNLTSSNYDLITKLAQIV